MPSFSSKPGNAWHKTWVVELGENANCDQQKQLMSFARSIITFSIIVNRLLGWCKCLYSSPLFFLRPSAFSYLSFSFLLAVTALYIHATKRNRQKHIYHTFYTSYTPTYNSYIYNILSFSKSLLWLLFYFSLFSFLGTYPFYAIDTRVYYSLSFFFFSFSLCSQPPYAVTSIIIMSIFPL